MKQRQILKWYDILWANARRYRAGAAQKLMGPLLWIKLFNFLKANNVFGCQKRERWNSFNLVLVTRRILPFFKKLSNENEVTVTFF
jgi:hypothetical protein